MGGSPIGKTWNQVRRLSFSITQSNPNFATQLVVDGHSANGGFGPASYNVWFALNLLGSPYSIYKKVPVFNL